MLPFGALSKSPQQLFGVLLLDCLRNSGDLSISQSNMEFWWMRRRDIRRLLVISKLIAAALRLQVKIATCAAARR